MYHPTMKFFLALFAMLAFASATDIAQQCSAKNPFVTNAIGKFCQNKALLVPSDYASRGMEGKYQYANVMILGTCSPPQWVPQEYCMSQLYDICAKGDKFGEGNARFGRNKCQEWRIVASNNGKQANVGKPN
ncbi:Hypothetical predicted protein [Lecanosticta acicola]|uniref:Uncharacterized protein n=1 Tax=Lecanosticta acicola TaxID=111012 RepID=A0AAI8Z9M2_9PEZI|nr:Hypothetical predicted protein [Lecanosticta acicola]